jgi:Rho termination factor, N-terminal domain
METYELQRMGVRELRKVCKENGDKNYAWLKKVELIFLIQGFDTNCGNCKRKLRVDEMQKYLDNPDESQGMDNNDEYLPCCFNCFQDERSSCYICAETYMNNSLELAIMEDGEEEAICIHCARCSKCSELITVICDGGIQQINWIDGSLICNICIDRDECDE